MTARETRVPADGPASRPVVGRGGARAGVAALVLLATALAACAPAPYARATFRAHDPESLARVDDWFVDLHPQLMTPEVTTERDVVLRENVAAELMDRQGARVRATRAEADGLIALYPHTHHTMVEVDELHFDDVEVFFLAGGRVVTRLMIHNGHVLHEDQMSPPFDDEELARFCAGRIAELLTGG